jgi:hypothetical protein
MFHAAPGSWLAHTQQNGGGVAWNRQVQPQQRQVAAVGLQKIGGNPIKGRFTMKIVSPTSYTFEFEMSPDGTNWTPVMDGKATKTK